ncbi:MAG: L-2-hydroxyglutarate oxidase [Acidimicrobiia bacterium]|nr:L-2-hydroxyglutarate oxidase [Acidimicrobiia bacterium]
MNRVDVVIVGGGIVGLATADALLRSRPELRLVLLEKEDELALHQSGRNSGVIHSGIYYRPGSPAAQLAVEGRISLTRFCTERGVPFEMTGKVIVATDDAERERLPGLLARGRENGVRVEAIGPARLRELEPHSRGAAALHVLDTGIVDFRRVCDALADQLCQAGAEIRRGWQVKELVERSDAVVVTSGHDSLESEIAVNCSGLFSDRLASSSTNSEPAVRIVPFRGEFHDLAAARRHVVRNMIYPLANPEFPFLGVHLTRGIDGRVRAGPNAVLALAREGYSWSIVDPGEVRELLRFPGFRKLARRYWRIGLEEMVRSVSTHALARALRALVPEIQARDLTRSPAGVRAQALSADGTLLDNFVIRETNRIVHVLNAQSPAATASLEIGRHIAERLIHHLD